MFLFVNFAPFFRGRSRQSCFLCVIAPQFSHAPLRYFLAADPALAPRSYQLSSLLEELSYSGCQWWFNEGAPVSRYHGACEMYSRIRKFEYYALLHAQGHSRGIWGLIGLPSSSRAAGAVPAFRAASRSFWRWNSSLESFPMARETIINTNFVCYHEKKNTWGWCHIQVKPIPV